MPDIIDPFAITLTLPQALVDEIDSKRGSLRRNQACVILIRKALANETDLIQNIAADDKKESR